MDPVPAGRGAVCRVAGERGDQPGRRARAHRHFERRGERLAGFHPAAPDLTQWLGLDTVDRWKGQLNVGQGRERVKVLCKDTLTFAGWPADTAPVSLDAVMVAGVGWLVRKSTTSAATLVMSPWGRVGRFLLDPFAQASPMAYQSIAAGLRFSTRAASSSSKYFCQRGM